MSQCYHCGASNRLGAKFCIRCGQGLIVVSTSPPPPLKTAVNPAKKNHAKMILGAGLLGLLLLALAWGIRKPEEQDSLDLDSGSVTISQATETRGTPVPTQFPLTIPGTDIEVPRITDEEEVDIGQEIAAEIEAELGVYHDKTQLARVAEIAQDIIPEVDRAHMPYTFTLLDTDEINAFAVPGGFIYITRGMLDFVHSDDELAGVIAHEIAHVSRKHGANRLEAIAVAQATGRRLLQQDSRLEDIYESEEGTFITEMTTILLLNGWSRRNEFEADEYGAIYMARAGYDPRTITGLFNRMDSTFADDDDTLSWLLSTHPPFADRIEWIDIVIVENEL